MRRLDTGMIERQEEAGLNVITTIAALYESASPERGCRFASNLSGSVLAEHCATVVRPAKDFLVLLPRMTWPARSAAAAIATEGRYLRPP